MSGSPLYDSDIFWVLKFTYPPFAAVVFTPLAILGPHQACVYRSQSGFPWVGDLVILLAPHFRGRRSVAMSAVGLTGLLFWLEPVRSTIAIGQINLLLMLLVLWDLTRRRGARWQGVGVGLATGIKLVPGIFVVYLLLTGRSRAAAVAGSVAVASVGVGFLVAPANSTNYWQGKFLVTSRIGELAETGNQSLSGLLARLAVPAPHSTIAWLLLALLLAPPAW